MSDLPRWKSVAAPILIGFLTGILSNQIGWGVGDPMRYVFLFGCLALYLVLTW